MITIDMKMPTDCNSCLIRKIMGCKIANESGWLNNRRDERCLLKEVVRCKDCIYTESFFGSYKCYFDEENESGCKRSHDADFFCACGERKEGR